MKTSWKGVLEIAEHEGLVPTVYRDSVGVLTYGVGHTAGAGAPNPATMSQAMPTGAALEAAIDDALRLFKADLAKYEARVNAATKVPLQQHQFDALVSFDFNTGGIHRAQLTKQINADDFSGAGFMGWLRPPEIRKRRTAEQRLFQTGDYDHNGNTIPIWGTNGKGKLTGIIRRMSDDELLRRLKIDATQQPERGIGAAIAAALTGLLAWFQRIGK